MQTKNTVQYACEIKKKEKAFILGHTHFWFNFRYMHKCLMCWTRLDNAIASHLYGSMSGFPLPVLVLWSSSISVVPLGKVRHYCHKHSKWHFCSLVKGSDQIYSPPIPSPASLPTLSVSIVHSSYWQHLHSTEFIMHKVSQRTSLLLTLLNSLKCVWGC